METKTSVAAEKRSNLEALPFSVRTRGGATFDPRSDFWSYRDGVSRVCINFTPIAGLLSSEMQQSLKVVLLWYAENASPHHINNMHFLFCHFVKYLWEVQGAAIQSVASIDLLNYKASLSSNKAWFLSNLSGFLKKWHRLRLPGVAEDVVSLLRDLRLKGNPRGVAVRTMDPVAGPYTDIELGAIQTALNDSFADGSIADDMYLLAWLFIALGQRPSQFAALKVGDVSGVLIDGQVHYNLKVPRAKQRDAHLRTQFKNRPLVSQIGKPLLEYAQRIRHRFEGRLAEPKDAPLFPSAVEVEGAPGYEFHSTGGNLSRRLSDTLRGLRVYSERTGDLLQISAIRFRRTFGTRAAQEGHGELVIAELLDHSDTQNVGVYVASVPEIAARIDRAIAMELAPLAQAFKGALINDESEATRCGDPSSRILDLRINRSTKPMGSCGQYSFCSFNAPIACYTCRYFEPWLDGPHEAVLKHLLEQREQLLVTTDRRMAAINDRTILAVAEVIQLCREAAEVVSNG
jgi:integrase